jgi:hypothetical protein
MNISEMILVGKPKVLEGMLVQVPIFPPQIPHGLSRDRSRVSTTKTR